MNIYQPSEDSYFLSNILKKELPKLLEENPNLNFLEIGAGSGIHLETACNLGVKKENISSCDINPASVSHCNVLGFNCIHSDLFEAFEDFKGRLSEGNRRCPRFDIIIFNPPYLPKDRFDKENNTSGGEKGDETIVRFLQQAKSHLKTNGKIFLLFSSRTPTQNINIEFKNYNVNLLGNEKLFYEELFIYKLIL